MRTGKDLHKRNSPRVRSRFRSQFCPGITLPDPGIRDKKLSPVILFHLFGKNIWNKTAGPGLSSHWPVMCRRTTNDPYEKKPIYPDIDLIDRRAVVDGPGR